MEQTFGTGRQEAMGWRVASGSENNGGKPAGPRDGEGGLAWAGREDPKIR